ncbi:MAG: aminotransferase class I/II-fold pyridoxal phosphate-dependent enzyme [Candidatus Eremiobacteraeota bacterium]|nr:aminotransferase class I/II-fold pyridoxal phosphate-dependent enzyme [Candidatus Eremiobacteraeota bacterium]
MDRDQIQRACTRFFGHTPLPVREQLLQIAGAAAENERADVYGGGELLESFEAELAELLGKEAAVFMPSGIMAQQIALRIHCDRRTVRNVAVHPQSHLVVDENDAMARLHHLNVIPVGDRNALYTLDDLRRVRERLGALVVELPERNIGGALRPWEEVLAITEWARENDIAVHLDGARVWESQPFYGKAVSEVAAPFDTVYVSFYKILNAVAGAAFAGPRDVINEARVWQWRHGGRLVHQYPMVVSARDGLRRYASRVPLYCERARGVAAVLSAFEQIVVTPNPPPTNMMHVYMRGDRERLSDAALRVSKETKVWMPPIRRSAEIPGWQMMEVACAEGSLQIDDIEVRDLFTRMAHYAAC